MSAGAFTRRWKVTLAWVAFNCTLWFIQQVYWLVVR